ncbi:MAG TPA: two-component regulator propeller domain-containing protein [Bryobacteraceae bacterium]
MRCDLKLRGLLTLIASLLPASPKLAALSPQKQLSQYTRTVWTQAEGLPQDTVRAMAETPDGYLWLGTEEGLARFDGYEFLSITKEGGQLPSNAITSLCAGSDGGLWIGSQAGLTRYSSGRFETFTQKNGLPASVVGRVLEDHTGALWIASGGVLARFQNGRFTTFAKQKLAPVDSVEVIYEDRRNRLWVGGVGGLVKRSGEGFERVLGSEELGGQIVTQIAETAAGLWLGGSQGVVLMRERAPLQYFNTAHGMPSNIVRALLSDRAGNLWLGTSGGLSRLEGERFVTPDLDRRGDQDWVRSLFEDREGDLWVGMNSALNRFRDGYFSVYGRSEGLPSDQPTAVHQNGSGEIWIGFDDSGLVAWHSGSYRHYTKMNGLAGDEIFAIRDARNSDLLVATRGGISRMHQGHFSNEIVPDPLGRTVVYDVLEDSRKDLWAATASGVYRKRNGAWQAVLRSDSAANAYAVSLAETSDGNVWAATLYNGLWMVLNASAPQAQPRLYTATDGVPNGQIRALFQDSGGTLWIGTFGGGLAAYREGVFHRYSAANGLLSDNISNIQDDLAGNLWLSTTRGICRISKQQLADFTAGKIRSLTPRNYGIEDGLRSSQCAPVYPVSAGGTRTRNGELWFPTGRGLAVFDTRNGGISPQKTTRPLAQVVEVQVDGRPVMPQELIRLKPGTNRIQFRYAGIYLAAPELIRYSTKLEGLDPDWLPASTRRSVNYTLLPHGHYRFRVRAELPEGGSTEAQTAFEILPHIYERAWFFWAAAILLSGTVYGMHQLRLRQMSGRFAAVLEERARIAREIHDTLAQGFVGICSQLDALALKLNGDPAVVRQQVDLARKMARYSLTEARRSVTDLRTPELEEQDLASALRSAAYRWTAASKASVAVRVDELKEKLPAEMGQNILRIAQEAVANALKHAKPRNIWVELERTNQALRLRVRDDGKGFEPSGTSSILAGHYGILGMRERAERLGGTFDLESGPEAGTVVEVTVPLDNGTPRIR